MAAKAPASIRNWPGWALSKAKVLPWYSDVARQAAAMPSYAVARAEVLERGLKLNIKEVHNISVHAGQAAITLRRRELELFRQDQLPAADGTGKRLGAMIDGGRAKLRPERHAGKEVRIKPRRKKTSFQDRVA